MKITPRQYAQSLYECVKAADREEMQFIIPAFVSWLYQNNHLSLADKIIKAFEKYYEDQEGVLSVEIKSARDLEKQDVSALKKILKEKRQEEEVLRVELKSEINQTLLGGLILQFKDKLIDGSLKTRLKILKERLLE